MSPNRMTELLLVSVVGFHAGRIGQMTLIEMGANEFGSHMAWLRAKNFEYLVQLMNRSNPCADDWTD